MRCDCTVIIDYSRAVCTIDIAACEHIVSNEHWIEMISIEWSILNKWKFLIFDWFDIQIALAAKSIIQVLCFFIGVFAFFGIHNIIFTSNQYNMIWFLSKVQFPREIAQFFPWITNAFTKPASVYLAKHYLIINSQIYCKPDAIETNTNFPDAFFSHSNEEIWIHSTLVLTTRHVSLSYTKVITSMNACEV